MVTPIYIFSKTEKSANSGIQFCISKDILTEFPGDISMKTRLNIEIVAGQLVPEFGYAPTQGQVIDYVFKKYLEK